MNTSIETITPDIAKALLALSTRNRRLRPAVVQKYARDMLDGHWKLNGESIVLDTAGRPLNGHHRLSACATSGANFQTVVVRGADTESFDTFDQGAPRSAADIFGLAGEPNATNIAAVLNVIALWENDWRFYRNAVKGFKHGMRIRMSMPELRDMLERHPGARYSLSLMYVQPYNGITSVMSISTGASMHYIFSQESTPELAENFIKLCATGADLAWGHPVLMLRQRLLADRAAHKQHYNSWDQRRVVVALIVKAWNAWREGRTIGMLRAPTTESIPEIAA